MFRRTLTLAVAVAATGAALVAGPASADSTCVSSTDEPIAGTTVCVDRNAVIAGWNYVPYYVGPICVSSVCSTPVSGSIPVPIVNGQAVQAYGTICVQVAKGNVCRSFSTAIIGQLIVLPPLQVQ